MADQGTSASASAAASRLAYPAERGTLSFAYRRSVVALQNAFGFAPTPSDVAEREPLLPGSNGQGHVVQEGGGEGENHAGPSRYGSVLDLPPERRVRKPKSVKGPVRVEAKVWFANERTWISWLRVSVLLGSFALALLNSANFFAHHHLPRDPPIEEPGPVIPAGPSAALIRRFGMVYAGIALLTLGWGLFNYQRRVTLIKAKYAGSFDDLIGPPVICVALFVAVLLNFIFRVQQHNIDVAQGLY